MTRVLQAMAGAPHGGAEAFFTRLVLALHRAGLPQRVLIRRNTARRKALEKGGIEPLELTFGGLLDFYTPRLFRRAVRDFRPEVVLTWMSRATRFCPRGDFVHVARLGGYYNLKHYQQCAHLVGNTKDLVAYMVREGWPAKRAHYLPNFVAARPAPPYPRFRAATPEGVPVVLALGRLHYNKAFDVLVRALARVPDAYLWIAGEGGLETYLAALAEKRGVAKRVKFLGWHDDPAALYAAADVLVSASRVEPLGNVILEGWSLGVPVVAANSAGPSELIDDGRTGLLVEVNDDKALAAAVSRVLANGDLKRRLIEGGRAAYEAEFTEDKVVRRYLDFFERVKGARARA